MCLNFEVKMVLLLFEEKIEVVFHFFFLILCNINYVKYLDDS